LGRTIAVIAVAFAAIAIYTIRSVADKGKVVGINVFFFDEEAIHVDVVLGFTCLIAPIASFCAHEKLYPLP